MIGGRGALRDVRRVWGLAELTRQRPVEVGPLRSVCDVQPALDLKSRPKGPERHRKRGRKAIFGFENEGK